ncbi:MAG TPA: ABC transporter permease [Acidobacteriota bacterium]|nr:ABC transporter permease [Acidobacteriota bacterium]
MKDILRQLRSGPLIDSLIAVLLAAAVLSIVVAAIGHNPITVLSLFICGGVGDLESIYGTLMSSMPLIFSGLSLALAFRAGLFNIGGEGQLFVGGFAAALAGHYLNLGSMTVVLMMAVAAAAGFAWAMVPIAIRLYRGAHEVIGCIMMNYIAINLCLWLVRGPFRAEASTEKTPPIQPGGWWPTLDTVGATDFNAAFFISLIIAVLVYWMLFRLPFGFELRAAGANPGAAAASGINVRSTLILTFGLSGALAGLGGAAEVSGVFGSFYSQFSPGYGFDGITVALLGRNHPVGVVAAALLFGMMRNASKLLQFEAEISADIIFLFQGIVIIALLAARPIRRAVAARLAGRA